MIGRRVFLLFSAVVSSAAGYGASRMSAHPTTTVPAAGIAKVALPSTVQFGDIAVFGGRLLVTGQLNSTTRGCAASDVDPVSLRLSPLKTGSCDSPQLRGESVAPVFVTNATMYGNVRIATAIPGRPTAYHLGPEVMPFEDISGGARPMWTYGDGSLWIYDIGPHAGQGGGASVLRISAVTGSVQNRVPMPDLYRPAMAADADGLWIGSSPGSGPSLLYHVPAGTNRVEALPRGDGSFLGMYATGKDLYFVSTSTSTDTETFWHLRGLQAVPVAHRVEALNPAPLPQLSAPSGLWGVLSEPIEDPANLPSEQPHRTSAVEIDPSTGQPLLRANLGNSFVWQTYRGVSFDGSLYFLLTGAPSGGELVRVAGY